MRIHLLFWNHKTALTKIIKPDTFCIGFFIIFEVKIMKKITLITILLMSAIWSGCGGTRQTNTQIKDSIHIENSYSQGTKMVLGNTFTYKPFDSLKPMIIDNVVYKNVIITNDKSKTIVKWNDRFITKTIVTQKNKQTEKSDNSLMWIGIALVVVLGIIAYLKIPSFKTGIHF